MKVPFMRWIDFWVGIPICFALSIINWPIKYFRKQQKPKKILFLELSEMGSTMLAYSAMKKAKERFGAELFFMIFKENEASIRLLDIIPDENVITIRSKSFGVFFTDIIHAIFKMRSLKIDTVIDLELFSRFTAILSFLSGARQKVGFFKYHMEGLYRGNFLTNKVTYNPHIHISENFMALVYSLEEDTSVKPLLKRAIKKEEIYTAKIRSSDEEKRIILQKIQELNPGFSSSSKIILLNPNASQLLPIRRWPIKNFCELAKMTLEHDKKAFVLITGTQAEKPDAKEICDYAQSKRCIDFTGRTSFKELIDLYNVSRILVTNDSGPAHFASLTEISIIAIFGPETPHLYSPLSKNCTCVYSNYACSPCVSAFNHRKTPCTESKCLEAIRPEEVFRILRQQLNSSP